eukprot:UN00443
MIVYMDRIGDLTTAENQVTSKLCIDPYKAASESVIS